MDVGERPLGGHCQARAYGYEPTREAAMAAFAKSWRRDPSGAYGTLPSTM
jgi:hypothetical protein